jgi:hypothetical protein
VANKGGVREEGTAGWLLAMARERGGGPVRRSRGAKDGGARRACPWEEDEGGPTRQRGRRGNAGWASRRPLDRLAGGPVRGRGEVGRGWVKNRKWTKVEKEIPFEFQLIIEIWQKFGKLHKEIYEEI